EIVNGSMTDFYWLHVSKPAAGQAIDASIDGNKVTLTTRKVTKLELRLDGRLLDFRKPLTVSLDGKKSEVKIAPSLARLGRTMAGRGDPHLAASCVVELTPGK